MMNGGGFDVAVVGAGVVGLAHALAAARLGKRVVVIDRDAQANGASVRNFGFITVTGQGRGGAWRRARRSRDVWDEVAAKAGIAIEHRGLTMVARRPEARDVLAAFVETEMGEGCELLSAQEARRRLPALGEIAGALYSPHDLRVESRLAIPRLAAWLEAEHGVVFLRGAAVHGVCSGRVATSRGEMTAEAVIVCPGDDLSTLYPDLIAQHDVRRCRLQMLRLADPGFRLPSAVMSDLGLVRYLGYSELPQVAAVRARLEAEQSEHLAHGVHLIVVQSADGSLVVGDSHHYADTPEPFASEAVDRLILDEYAKVLGAPPPVLERWTGTYAFSAANLLIEAPEPGVRVVMVTSGNGASTAFGLAEEVIGDLYNVKLGAAA